MNAVLAKLLQQTSRSFYLTLRVLPRRVRLPIGLAYLLARTTDTIADTEIVPVAERLATLRNLRERILGTSGGALQVGELARHQGRPAERALLERVEDSLTSLTALAPDDLKLVRQVLDTIISGQELDLRRFAPVASAPPYSGDRRAPDRRPLVALQTAADLDDYTYRVAGCVGEFWTKLCRAHLFPRAKLDDAQLLADGVRFGKGLQLVNILRDLPADLRQGRCYLPEQSLTEAGLKPADLLQPANESRLRPVYHRHLDLAAAHLAAGWAYTNALPWRCARLRLACAWPILIGVETLARLRTANILDPQPPVKISRTEVRRLIARSVWCYPFPGRWRRLGQFPAAETSAVGAASRPLGRVQISI